MQSVNPYQPPAAANAQPAPDSSPRFFASLVPASLAIGLAMIAWFVLVSIFDLIIARGVSMLLWSLTLFLSSSLSIITVNRVWRYATHPLAFGSVFALFSVVFLVAEGDTSNGTDHWNMAFVYLSLLVLPFTSYLVARRGSQKRNVHSELQDISFFG